jgi:hypothetical protein
METGAASARGENAADVCHGAREQNCKEKRPHGFLLYNTRVEQQSHRCVVDPGGPAVLI